MSKNWKLIHIKSKQRGEDELSPKLPTSEQLEYGEIAINYGHDIETIAIRNDNDEIIKFIPEHKVKEYVDRRINELLAEVMVKSPFFFVVCSFDSGVFLLYDFNRISDRNRFVNLIVRYQDKA